MDDNTIGTIAELARQAVQTEIKQVSTVFSGPGDCVPFVVLERNRTLHSVDNLVKAFEKVQTAPIRRRGTYHAADLASFLAWMDANTAYDAPVFAQGAEKLVGEWRTPKLALAGIGNYSKELCSRDTDDEGSPKGSPKRLGWHDFGARYDFPVTEAWLTWASKHREWFEQVEFAEFIETRLHEISQPVGGEKPSEALSRFIEMLKGDKDGNKVASPAKLFELSRGLKITATTKMEQKIDRQSGEATLVYSEEHSGPGGHPIKVPSVFYIRIPVFFGEDPSLIGVLLRYRTANGTVKWSYELFAPDLVVRAEFDRICETVRQANQTLYLGSPDIQP